jgi:type I restriction enzyme S subunit
MIFNVSKYNSDWAVKSLNKLGDFSRGKSKHRPRNDRILFENGKYPFIQTGEIKSSNLFIRNHYENYNELGLEQSKIWPENTLCITIAANIAETALLGYPMCFPDSVVGFTAHPEESSELFMHYVFTYIKKYIQNIASGSIQDNINIGYLSSLYFRIPRKDYQDKVNVILSSLDSKIELNNRINSELEAMAKTLYDYWFIQFDFPNENGKPYKSSGEKMVWNEELKREIPKGWEVKEIKELLTKNNQKHDFNCEYEDLDTIDLSVMPSGTMCLNKRGCSKSFKTNLFKLKKYDILFGGIRPYLLKAGFSPFDGLVTGTVHSFRVKNEDEYNFLILTMSHRSMFNFAVSNSKGTKMPVIGSDDLVSYKLAYNKKIINKFNSLVFFKEIIVHNIIENQKLSELRDWLLPMLMNGQVTVQ